MNRREEFDDQQDELDYVSKTQLKKEADDLKKLGLELLDIGASQRKQIQLDDELLAAFAEADKINRKKDGFRRQIQFIGKLLRQRDVEPIKLALSKLKNAHLDDVQKFHKLEKLRDKLIDEGDPVVQEIVETYDTADRQKLRQLVRQAKKEQSQEKPPAASREIFKYLRQLSEG